MRIVLTGGGTGGHAYPAIGVAQALQAIGLAGPPVELLYLGSTGGIEESLASSAGIPFRGLPSRKLSGKLSLGSVRAAFTLGRGFVQAIRVLNEFKPDLVIGTGGYVSAAVVMAQAFRRGPILIHEQNVIPGRTNLWLSKYATKVCVTFESSASCFPSGKTVVTGLPIRSALLDLPGREESRTVLGLDPEKFTLLVLGGSQGARRINEVIADSIPGMRKLPVQVLHQTGRANYEGAEKRRRSSEWDDYHVSAYYEDMRPVYAAADLVIGRAGASTIAEITAVGLPAIFVPYPFAYADHQRYNGEFVAGNGGGIVINESNLNPGLLVETIHDLLTSPDRLRQMADASRRLGRPNAAEEIASLAIELAGS